MNNTKFNFAAVISIIVLLFYSYIVFLGLVYWLDGNKWKGLLYTLILIAVIIACVFFMCKARATRWEKIGNTGQILFGVIILAALVLSSMPFAHFLKLVHNQKQVTEAFEKSHKYASDLDLAYKDYVKERKEVTLEHLNAVEAGHGASNPAEYDSIFGMPGSDDSRSKINRMITNLEKTLLPESLERANEQNIQRLERGAKMSVWNVEMPGIVNRIDETVKKNIEIYTNISKNAHGYKGDNNYQAFTYPAYASHNAKLQDMLDKMSMPSVLSIIAALICFGFMLLPYYLTERDVAAATSSDSRKKSKDAASTIITAPSVSGNRRSRLREHQDKNK